MLCCVLCERVGIAIAESEIAIETIEAEPVANHTRTGRPIERAIRLVEIDGHARWRSRCRCARGRCDGCRGEYAVERTRIEFQKY